jgi:CO/xanthine dehydrogenase FAD-binding subunit
VVVGSVVETPLVITAESWNEIDPVAIARDIEPVSDIAGSSEYKKHITEVYVRRVIGLAQGRSR